MLHQQPSSTRPGPDPRLIAAVVALAVLILVVRTFWGRAGLPFFADTDDAMRMVVETMGGTADYLARHDYDGPELRRRVATPGGTTEKGLITLEENGLRNVCRAAVDAVVEATR